MADTAVSGLTPEEFMAVLCAREIRVGDKVGVGVVSPVATAAALLASRLGAPKARYEVPRVWPSYFRGSHEMTGYANQGRVDLFFLSAAQLDAAGDINLEFIGPAEAPKKRFFGAFAAPVYYATMRRIVLFLPEHSPRVLVPRVDRRTAVADSGQGFRRNGGPTAIVTPKAVFDYDHAAGRVVLRSIHPGETADSIRAATGFALGDLDNVGVTPPPSPAELQQMRGPVLRSMTQIFPGWGAAPTA